MTFWFPQFAKEDVRGVIDKVDLPKRIHTSIQTEGLKPIEKETFITHEGFAFMSIVDAFDARS